jgi:predicted Zn-dependent protease
MDKKVISLLKKVRAYALKKNINLLVTYQEEDSYLMRFANSAISLNTNEHLVRLQLLVMDGRKKASYDMIVDPREFKAVFEGVDKAAQMVKHAAELNYDPTFPVFKQTVVGEASYDPRLARLSSAERLAYFNKVAAGLETEDYKLSGIFMDGTTTNAQMSTATEHYQYFRATDAKVTAVISSESLKWEVIAEQSAQKKSDLKPALLNKELKLLVKYYSKSKAAQLPLGKYNVVFGPAAIAEVAEIMGGWSCQGAAMKRGFSFLKDGDQGTQVLSPKFSMTDDPNRAELYGQSHDMVGFLRQPFKLFEAGKFNNFTWDQDSADEYGQQTTGNSVEHNSFVVDGGEVSCGSLSALLKMRRDQDVLYIPYIHYINIVNPSKGLITGSSRFGALLLKKNGRVVVPYNVRVTQAFRDFFGERVEWLSKEQVAYNTSSTYGARNPTALLVPRFMCVKDIEISHSNSSY